jgi:hypothetical protein
MNTNQQFDEAIGFCRELFVKKLTDYGLAWRIMRQKSITDQIFIKASRIRNIEEMGIKKVDEDIFEELVGIINYSIIALIQIELNRSKMVNTDASETLILYDDFVDKAKKLMQEKNHDYNEAWRLMRTQSYTDLILQKINRIKSIEDNKGRTLASEGIEANYYDMINYAVFYIIKYKENTKQITTD